VAPVVNATVFEISKLLFTINPVTLKIDSMTINYIAGNMSGTPPALIQVGTEQTIEFDESECEALCKEQPTMYPTIKSVVYGVIQKAKGVTGVAQ
jgi:hypothetical protein